MRKHTQKIKIWFAISMLTIITFGMALSMYENYYPIHVIDIHSPLKIKTPIVKAGGVMVYIADYCQYKQYPATVSRTLLDGTAILMPLVHSVGELGCHTREIQVPIPFGSLPGIYHMEGIATYQINPTRTEDYKFYSVDFRIIK